MFLLLILRFYLLIHYELISLSCPISLRLLHRIFLTTTKNSIEFWDGEEIGKSG